MVNMKGSTRLLDKVLIDGGTATARTLQVYGITSIDELLNVPILVKSNFQGTADATTVKINDFDAIAIKVMNNGVISNSYNNWVINNQLYNLIYNGVYFTAFPLGANTQKDISYNSMKLDFNAFSTSTKDNLITKVGAETLGELLYNLEQNVDCDYIFIKNSSIETMNMPCVFNYHEYVSSSSLSLHIVMLSNFYDKTLYTFTIEYSYSADDNLTIMDYNISQIDLRSINDFKYTGATKAFRIKSTSSSNVIDPMSGESNYLEEYEGWKTLYADDLFDLSSTGEYITVTKRCMLDIRGTFEGGSTTTNASNKRVYMVVSYEDNDIGGLFPLAASEIIMTDANGTFNGEFVSIKPVLVEAGTKIYTAVNTYDSGWTGVIYGMSLTLSCLALA